jgi:hypothetical protein
MCNRADPTYSGDDRLNVFIASSSDHRLKEPRGFGHLPLQRFNPAVGDVYDDISVPLNTRYMMNVDIDIVMHL